VAPAQSHGGSDGLVRKKINLGFGCALALLVAIDVVSYFSLRRLLDTVDSIAHQQRMLEQLDQVLLRLQDAETGQRGYIITGDESYLAPYHSAIDTIEQELRDLEGLTIAHDQEPHVARLRQLIPAKLQELQATIDARGRL